MLYVVVEGNHVSGSVEEGIILQARVNQADAPGTARLVGVLVRNNNFFQNGDAGVRVQARFPGGEIEDLTVKDNSVSGNSAEGIFFTARQGGTLTKSKIEKNKASEHGEHGINLVIDGAAGSALTEVRVENNTTFGNAASGILAATAVGVNNFHRNKSSLNGNWGYFDAASPGLANIYTDNLCNFNAFGASSPAGLCTPP